MNTKNLSTLKIHKLTQEQYERELAAGRIDENALYLTPDEEIDLSDCATVEQLQTKADVEHEHQIDDVVGLQEAIDDTKSYTDSKISGLASTSFVNTSISTHNTSDVAHTDIRDLITSLTTKLNNFLDVDDTTADQLSEVLVLIENNKGTLESLTSSKVNVADIINNLTTNVTNKPLSAAQGVAIKALIDALEDALEDKAATSDLTAHTGNKNNPHGVSLSQLGVTATAAELNYVDGVTSNIQTQLNNKLGDFSIEIYNGTSGNPKPVKFTSFNYSTCDSENGIAVKISLVSGHGNGSSYAFLEDVILKVGYTGNVEVNTFKYYGASAGTYDSANRCYGDIFYVIDETNKIVDFYCLMGQYARVYQTPWKRLTYSSGGIITQYTNCTVYSSGTKVYGNNNNIVLMDKLNRTTAVNAADENYTTYMARGTSLNSAETNPTVNGTIAWTYE